MILYDQSVLIYGQSFEFCWQFRGWWLVQNNMNKFLQIYAHTYGNYNEMPTVQFSI